ncbi:MAG TPA: EAL domain-containing protein, partial [Vicinamibacteria bacterium]|nr:EAL domain-containing protein [Vicinamibacteria bacterium]
IEVVAEGVETEDDLRTVAALGIDLVQGFLLSRPFYPRAAGAVWAALPSAGDRAPDPIRGWPPPEIVRT